MAICNDTMKSRVIRFRANNDDRPAEQAAASLKEVHGILGARAVSEYRMRVQYDVRYLTLQRLEQALSDVGFILDDSIVQRIKRAIFAYCEDALRAQLGIDEADSEQNKISIPEKLVQDPRPDNWRHYT